METVFSHELRAHLTIDDDKRVRQVQRTEYNASVAPTALAAAREYLARVAGTLEIPTAQLEQLHQRVSFLDPRPQEIQYRFHEAKKFFGSSTLSFYQTIDNTPVWDGGLTVEIKENPPRVIAVDHRGHRGLQVQLPPPAVVARVRERVLEIASAPRQPTELGLEAGPLPRPTGTSFREVFALSARRARAQRAARTAWVDAIVIKRALFYVYRFVAAARQPVRAVDLTTLRDKRVDLEATDVEITLPLPALPRRVRDGQHYLVVEILFHLTRAAKDRLTWKALVEVESGAILWLRAMVAGVNGLVFTYDPKTSTGDLTNTPDDPNATLNPLRDDEVLLNLDAPVAGTQSLAGTHVAIIDDDAPTIAAPTQPAATDFDYDARTNDFAAVNAYYHANQVFDVIADLGFNVATYFNGTSFPVHVDHRASFGVASGIEVNAFCNGDGATDTSGDGIGLVGYCLSDLIDTTNPLGRSVDKWVHWHEIGGHGILYDHVNGPNFGFAHSAGDSLAAFQNDPESSLRTVNERFQYAPFRDWPGTSSRWFNRAVVDDWGWGGANDTGGYQTEQIIATTLFRVYQSLGGDATALARRKRAARIATFLVLGAVGKLTPAANANSPTDLYNKLVDADADDWTSEGLIGGACKKVLRWSFEKQGLWNGAPPAVDLYIDDGRGGEYQFKEVHWNNPSVWNRTASDGLTGQQQGVAGVESYAYVKVKNRGTTDATGTVKVYHCVPGAGLTWPTDFVQAGAAAGLATGTVLANNGNEVIIGPFAWTPNVNAYGHDCLIAIVETTQDPSNVSTLGPGESMPEWRFIPHDNNVGQRNVVLAPGGGGGEALVAALDGAFFIAGNTSNKPAVMELAVDVPRPLAARGWRLGFAGLDRNTFRLQAGEKRRIELRVTPGTEFSPDDVRAAGERTLTVQLHADGALVGGMSYTLDPDMVAPARAHPPGAACEHAAQGLLQCLHVAPGQKVRRVYVKKVSVDIELEHDTGCE